MKRAFYFSLNTAMCVVQDKAYQILLPKMSGIVKLLHSVDHMQIDEPSWTKSPPIYGHTDHLMLSMTTTGTDYTEH